MNQLELTLLDYNQITYGEEYLDIMDKIGTKCAITDFAILLGGLVSYEYITKEGCTLDNKSKYNVGLWWTKTQRHEFNCFIGDIYGSWSWHDVRDRGIGIRPVLSYVSISQICTTKVSGFKDIIEVEYGEYPQYIVSKELSKTLEELYINNNIKQTGKRYTTDSVEQPPYSPIRYYRNLNTYLHSSQLPFRAKEHIEYEYNEKKYIRFVGDSNCNEVILSDGTKVEEGKPYWVEVSPIKWMIDEKKGIALSKNIIVSGIQFSRNNYTGDFEEAEIYKFLNEILVKDIIPSNMSKEDIQTVVASEDVPGNDVVDVINQIVEKMPDSKDINKGEIKETVVSKDILGNDEAEATKQMVEETTGSDDMEEELDEVNLDDIDLDDDSVDDDFEDLDIVDEDMDMVEETTGSDDIISILMMIIKILKEAAPLPSESIEKINKLLEKLATMHAGSESLVAEISELIKKNQEGSIIPSSDMQFVK